MINIIKKFFIVEPRENAIAAKIEIKEMPAKNLWR